MRNLSRATTSLRWPINEGLSGIGLIFLVRVLAIVSVAEAAVTLFLHWLGVDWGPRAVLLDAVLLTLLVAYPVYSWAVLPLVEHRTRLSEERRHKSDRALKTLSRSNWTMVQATDETALLRDVCRIIVEDAGYRMAWVGFARQDEGKTIQPVAWAGYEKGFLEAANMSWADVPEGRGAMGAAIRSGMRQVVRDIARDAAFAPWREEAMSRGYASVMAIPLIANERTFGGLAIYAVEPDAFDVEEVRLLTELGTDLAYGISALRMRAQHEQAERALHLCVKRYRELFDNANDVIATLDPAGIITSINQAGARILGHTCEEIPGTNISHFLSPESRQSFLQDIESTLAGAVSVVSRELEVISKDGRRFTIEANATIVHQNHAPVEVQIIARDVTERRRLEEQLRQAQKMEAIGQLAGGVAHDFNNLLSVILGYSDLVLSTLDATDSRRRKIEQIYKAAERATVITRQLLAFSRKQIMEPRVLDINTVVTEMSKMLGRLIGEDIELVIRLNAESGRIRADRGQLEQVIMNLAVNARDAMPRGGKLHIETANVELDESLARRYFYFRHSGPYVLLRVSDTGHGIDKETQAHIFEPFFTTKEHGKGTGLGLATVYGIVKQSDGYIWVDSQPGRGATFEIYLPRVEEAAKTAEPVAVSAISARGTETILLVEDEELVRELARECLSELGYTVLEARSAEEAVRLCEAHEGQIHLLLTDVVMPGMSGRQLAEQLAKERRDMKVLYMSGYTEDIMARRGILETGLYLLKKPFTRQLLAGKVREVLDAGEEKRP